MKTNETQTVRMTGAAGGTFTLTFDGQTTAPIAVGRDGGRHPVRPGGAEQRRAG